MQNNEVKKAEIECKKALEKCLKILAKWNEIHSELRAAGKDCDMADAVYNMVKEKKERLYE